MNVLKISKALYFISRAPSNSYIINFLIFYFYIQLCVSCVCKSGDHTAQQSDPSAWLHSLCYLTWTCSHTHQRHTHTHTQIHAQLLPFFPTFLHELPNTCTIAHAQMWCVNEVFEVVFAHIRHSSPSVCLQFPLAPVHSTKPMGICGSASSQKAPGRHSVRVSTERVQWVQWCC